jgi:hypothetical protein
MLAHGKATVVYDKGVYAEMPDDCVRKVPVNDRDSLASALRALALDGEDAARMGARAKAFVDDAFSLARYVEQLLQFLERHRSRWAVQVAARDAALRASRELQRIGLGMAPFGHPVVDSTARWATEQA